MKTKCERFLMIERAKILSVVTLLALFSYVIIPVSGISSTNQPSSQDTFISSMFTGLNYGGAGELIVYATSSTWNYRVLVQFDLSSIPPGSTVTSATLKLNYYRWATNDPAGRTLWANRLTQSWTEMGVTWSRYDGTNLWSNPGGDYDLGDSASATVPSSFGWMTWTVTDIVKAWVEDSEPNYGFLIKEEAEGAVSASYMAYFYSREYEETELQPILEIEYTPPSTIESCDSFGTTKDTFDLGNNVYVKGSISNQLSLNIQSMNTGAYPIYVVEDSSWSDDMPIPPRVPGTEISVTPDISGNIDPTLVWNSPLTPGKYDIVVDVNNNGFYDVGIDALDDSDIEVTAGFFVIPEFWFGTILGLAACFSALAGFLLYKRKPQ